MTLKHTLLTLLIDVIDAVIDMVSAIINWRWFSPRFIAYRFVDVVIDPILGVYFAVLKRVLGADHPWFEVTPHVPTDGSKPEDFTLVTSARGKNRNA